MKTSASSGGICYRLGFAIERRLHLRNTRSRRRVESWPRFGLTAAHNVVETATYNISCRGARTIGGGGAGANVIGIWCGGEPPPACSLLLVFSRSFEVPEELCLRRNFAAENTSSTLIFFFGRRDRYFFLLLLSRTSKTAQVKSYLHPPVPCCPAKGEQLETR